MKRTRQCYAMLPPEVYQILKENESNISLYIYDLIAADLIKRGKLTVKRLLELKVDMDEEAEATEVTDATDQTISV